MVFFMRSNLFVNQSVDYPGLPRFIPVYPGLSRFCSVYSDFLVLSRFSSVQHGVSRFIRVYPESAQFSMVQQGKTWFSTIYAEVIYSLQQKKFLCIHLRNSHPDLELQRLFPSFFSLSSFLCSALFLSHFFPHFEASNIQTF